MQITDSFRVNRPLAETWEVLLDIEQIAPCLPGAQLQEVEGDEYRGVVKVKVGPISAQYKGTARLATVDASARTIVIDASGRDTRGQGNASAKITVQMADDAGGTKVDIDTDLSITGKVAQFGRGVLADVSGKLLKQFVDNLERDVLAARTRGSGVAAAAESAPPAARALPAFEIVEAATEIPTGSEPAALAVPPLHAPGPRRIDSPDAKPVDLLETAGAPLAKRLVPLLAVALVVLVIWRRRRRRARS